MYLSELIERLEKEPNKFLKLGFSKPHSYRGDYADIAFEPTEGAKVSDMLYDAKTSMGKVFRGYKGGDFEMGKYTDCYLANYGDCGEELGPLLLEYMLKDELR